MSYCGAVDRYPDTREWAIRSPARSAGTPTAIRTPSSALTNAAARTVHDSPHLTHTRG